MNVRIRQLESIVQDIDGMREKVTARAHQLFRERGGELGRALDDWLTAERELVWRPAVELSEHDRELCLELAAAGVEAKDLDVRVTRDDVVVSAPTHHGHDADAKTTVHVCEFRKGRLFRSVHFPRPVDPAQARAEYRNGLLRITVPLAAESAQRVVIGEDTSLRVAADAEC